MIYILHSCKVCFRSQSFFMSSSNVQTPRALITHPSIINANFFLICSLFFFSVPRRAQLSLGSESPCALRATHACTKTRSIAGRVHTTHKQTRTRMNPWWRRVPARLQLQSNMPSTVRSETANSIASDLRLGWGLLLQCCSPLHGCKHGAMDQPSATTKAGRPMSMMCRQIKQYSL